MRSVRIRVRGQVQGVGYRPFVWRLAHDLGISGIVRNDADGVLIEASGQRIDEFTVALKNQAPALAKVISVEAVDAPELAQQATFEIAETETGVARTNVTPDAIVCTDCIAEINDPNARRFRYAFTNCTNCGPRFSIVESIPYDRASTTMHLFEMCADCRSEYEDPADRRFHAQPIACPACGPKVWLEDASGELDIGDPIAEAARRLHDGQILALKGIGGFHLACDALNDDAVSRLRSRKHRPAKPFALMALDIETIRQYALVSDDEANLLQDPAAPVLLLEAAGETLTPSIAPNQWALGWMLPTSPFHMLILQDFGRPLVMTSGNLSGEPQVIGNDEARKKLSPFVDTFVLHDRPIARRLDDSVARIVDGVSRVQRRARGYAPDTLSLPDGLANAPPVAAYGAFLKSAICLTQHSQALLSHHLGDLSDALTVEEFEKADRDYAVLMNHSPEVIACDLHPDYPSTAQAEYCSDRLGVPLVRIQHHHAHIAAVMAENHWPTDAGPVLGVALDGLGWGTDDTVWGGEFLLCDYTSFVRVGHLYPVPLPGGGAAQREPWRNLLAQLDSCGLEDRAELLLKDRPVGPLRAAVDKGVNSPLTSSVGRMFDAVSALLGLAPDSQSYEGEAAMALEAAARPFLNEVEPYPFDVANGMLNPAPLWHAMMDDVDSSVAAGAIAARFHVGLANAVCDLARALAEANGAKAIGFSGGCFQNASLLSLCLNRLENRKVLTHSLTPPNDGSVALGQAVIAAAKQLN